MCLDWLDQHDEAAPYFSRADALDPNNYFIAANIGWHYVQIADYAAVRSWMRRSLLLHGGDNPIATTYLDLAEQKLNDRASGQNNLPPGF
jgi:tetratricopeptide (TPR) repeat protein